MRTADHPPGQRAGRRTAQASVRDGCPPRPAGDGARPHDPPYRRRQLGTGRSASPARRPSVRRHRSARMAHRASGRARSEDDIGGRLARHGVDVAAGCQQHRQCDVNRDQRRPLRRGLARQRAAQPREGSRRQWPPIAIVLDCLSSAVGVRRDQLAPESLPRLSCDPQSLAYWVLGPGLGGISPALAPTPTPEPWSSSSSPGCNCFPPWSRQRPSHRLRRLGLPHAAVPPAAHARFMRAAGDRRAASGQDSVMPRPAKRIIVPVTLAQFAHDYSRVGVKGTARRRSHCPGERRPRRRRGPRRSQERSRRDLSARRSVRNPAR